MTRVFLAVLLLAVCSVDGYQHYKEQQATLKQEFRKEVALLQLEVLKLKYKQLSDTCAQKSKDLCYPNSTNSNK